jgi:nucleoid-associated protein YejK
MRYSTSIELDQIIVHILNPRDEPGLVLSERALPLDSNQRLAKYFTSHIQGALQDPVARAAQFAHFEDGVACCVCKGLLDGSVELVDGSQRLARQLYEIIERDQRISPCDLAICFYRAGNRPEVPRYLALLKLDPTEAFRHKTEQDEEGRRYVSYEIETDMLPTAGERLQKCAFVQPVVPRPEYDMMLVDRQISPTDGQMVARFFVSDFLGAALALDPFQRTGRLYKGLVSAHNQLRRELTPAEDESLRQAIDNVVTLEHVNVDELLRELPLASEHKHQVDQVLSRQLPDREFEIDPNYAGRLTRKLRFRGDGGLRIDVSAEAYDQVISVQRVDEPGTPPYYRVVIRTEKWEQVPR